MCYKSKGHCVQARSGSMRAARSRRWRHLWYFIFAMNRGYCSSAMCATRYRDNVHRARRKERKGKEKKIWPLLRFKIIKLPRTSGWNYGWKNGITRWATVTRFFDVRHLVSFQAWIWKIRKIVFFEINVNRIFCKLSEQDDFIFF